MLPGLDDYLLHEIFSYFDHDKPTLCQLALTCGRFNSLTSEHIWRHVTVKTPLDIFHAAMDQEPSPANFVRVINTRGSPSDITTVLPPPLLRHFTNLRSVSITLRSRSLTMTQDVVNLMFIKSLEYLCITHISHLECSKQTGGPTQREYHTSNLKSLELGGFADFCMSEVVLHELLMWPKSLKKLHTSLPGRSPKLRLWDADVPLTPLSMAKILWAIEPLKNSLEDLELWLVKQKWTMNDGSQLDLSTFDVLKRISVPALCFFNDTRGTHRAHPSRDGFYKLLPFALQQLEMDFREEEGIFWLCPRGAGPDRELALRGIESVPRWQYEWISEIVVQKKNCFPNLNAVCLTENYRRCGGYRPTLGWTQPWFPPTLSHLVEKRDSFGSQSAAGIQFTILIRKPVE